jgi:hypothetical protein
MAKNYSELLYSTKILVKQSYLFEILYAAYTTLGHCDRNLKINKIDGYFSITN